MTNPDNPIMQFVISEFTASADLLNDMATHCCEAVLEVGRLLANTMVSGKKILIFGNGGSAADAQHFAAELVGHYRRDRQPLPALALTTDTSALTAIGNDMGFDQVFVRPVFAFAQPGDVVIGISTSGHSVNVLEALKTAHEKGALTVALIGEDDSGVASIADLVIAVPSKATPRIQEAHTVIIHILCDMIEQAILLSNAAVQP